MFRFMLDVLVFVKQHTMVQYMVLIYSIFFFIAVIYSLTEIELETENITYSLMETEIKTKIIYKTKTK